MIIDPRSQQKLLRRLKAICATELCFQVQTPFGREGMGAKIHHPSMLLRLYIPRWKLRLSLGIPNNETEKKCDMKFFHVKSFDTVWIDVPWNKPPKILGNKFLK